MLALSLITLNVWPLIRCKRLIRNSSEPCGAGQPCVPHRRPVLGLLHAAQRLPLTDIGTLRNSLSEHYDNDTALVGTNMVYAAIHHFGGMAGRGRKVRIPARPFMTLTNEDKQDLLDDV